MPIWDWKASAEHMGSGRWIKPASPQERKTRNGRHGGERDAETEASSKHWLMAAVRKEVYATALCILSPPWISTRGIELGRKPCDVMESDKLQFGLGICGAAMARVAPRMPKTFSLIPLQKTEHGGSCLYIWHWRSRGRRFTSSWSFLTNDKFDVSLSYMRHCLFKNL